MNICPGRDPYTVFTSILVSRLVSGYYPVLTDTYILYHVNDVKIHTSEQQLMDLRSQFSKSAFRSSVWIQIHIDIDFTKLGATAFIISFLRLRCGAHLIHQPTGDNVVEPLREGLIALMSQNTEML